MKIHRFNPGANYTFCGLDILQRKSLLQLTCLDSRITCKICSGSRKSRAGKVSKAYLKAKG